MKLILITAFVLLLGCTSSSQKDINLNVDKKTLDNGLTLLLINRVGAPVFSAYVRVKVGSIEESKGSSGLAHFFEHMAFKGTKKIGSKDYTQEAPLLAELHQLGTQITEAKKKGVSEQELALLLEKFRQLNDKNQEFIEQNEFVTILQRNGGADLNATTSNDFTSYFVSLPSNKLDLWAYMESERLKDPVLREFYKERDVVFEERLMRYEINPEGKLYESFMDLSFDESPYKVNVIGYAQDIKNYTYEAARKFRDDFYIPSRMVVSVVGHFDDPKQTMATLEKYFSSLPAKTDTPPHIKQGLVPNFPRHKVIEFPSEPRFYMGFHRPSYPDPDDVVFDVLEQILCEGRTARLYKSIVDQKKLASSVNCFASLPATRLNGLFSFYAAPLVAHTNQEVMDAILAEVELVKNQGVSQEELDKVAHQIDAELVYSLESNMGLASLLSFFESLTGDWRYIYQLRDRIHKVTNEDIKRVASQYFVDSKRSSVFLEKSKDSNTK